MKFVAMWRELEGVMLRKICQREKDKYWMRSSVIYRNKRREQIVLNSDIALALNDKAEQEVGMVKIGPEVWDHL